MWSRRRLDIAWPDLLFGAVRVCCPPDRAAVTTAVESLCMEQALICLSVRSGFDLALQALDLPRGGEVLVSAITIPDMVRIIERHGLTPVPVDLDPERLTPTPETWQAAITPKTKAILAAHLFGGRTSMDSLAELARRHKLLLFEDCAQAFAGLGFHGSPQADVSMFSFGIVKTCTALGGAVLYIRNRDLLARMRAAQATYPVQGPWRYFKRLAKCAGLKALSCRPICGLIAFLCRAAGGKYDHWVNRAARGFRGDDFWTQIHQQPSAPLLAVLQRRLRGFDQHRFAQHLANGKQLAALLDDRVPCPGAAVAPHSYWVFPILVEEPEEIIERLAQAGFDATQGQSMCVVGATADHPGQGPRIAQKILTQVVFLPLYPELPLCDAKRMAATILAEQSQAIAEFAG